MQEEKPVRRGVYILPNLFTTASLFTGFLAMLLAVQGNIEGSALAILFSALMDGLDGKVARLTNTASEFGIQYDSLADLVAFGVAPAAQGLGETRSAAKDLLRNTVSAIVNKIYLDRYLSDYQDRLAQERSSSEAVPQETERLCAEKK